MSVLIARISDATLSLDEHVAAVSDPAVGAVATFIGTVRDRDPDASGDVVALEYTAHPDAEAALRALAEAAAASLPVSRDGHPGVRIAVSHRIGRLAIGDLAVVIAVASPHRAEAFDVCRSLIETIKTDLPVWKRQIEADGTTAWKGLGG